MMTIPEIASQIVNKTLAEPNETSSRTIFLVGSKSVGKSTLLYSFLEKTDTPRETLVLEYSFGRKSNQKQGIEKTICHVWEYGGKLDLLTSVLDSVQQATRGNWYYCIMLDISKIKSFWSTLETCIRAIVDRPVDDVKTPEVIIICGKYDIFKNYDSEIKKFICTTVRSVALLLNAHLIFYSCKEPQLVRRAKDVLFNIGFGNSIPLKEKNTNYTKPLVISKGSDSWESIGIQNSTIEQIKSRHVSRIPLEPDSVDRNSFATVPQRTHPEPLLDSIASLKYEEIRNLQSLDISLNDYLLELH